VDEKRVETLIFPVDGDDISHNLPFSRVAIQRCQGALHCGAFSFHPARHLKSCVADSMAFLRYPLALLLSLLSLFAAVHAINGTLSNPCAVWNTCELCTTTTVCVPCVHANLPSSEASLTSKTAQICHLGSECTQCGWCPSDSTCYVTTFDCTSWVPYNATNLCPPPTRTCCRRA